MLIQPAGEHLRYGDGLGGTGVTLFSTYDALNRTLTVLEDENGNDQSDAGERLSGYQYVLPSPLIPYAFPKLTP